MALATAYPHVTAFLDLLSGQTFTTHLGVAPANATAPYAVIYPDAGAVEQTSLVPDEGFVAYLSVHGIGEGPEQALWVIDHVRSAVVGAQPTVAGRSVWRIWQEQSPPPITRDDDVSPPLYVAYAEFGMRSEAN